MTLPWRGDPQVLARCLVPLPLPPTPSPPPFRSRLFRLHHLLSYPYQELYRDGTSSHSGIVVSLHPLFERVTVSFFFGYYFLFFFFFSFFLCHDVVFLLCLFRPVFIYHRAPRCSVCFFTIHTAFFRDGLVTRLHRSPLFASYGTLFAFLPFSPPPWRRRVARFIRDSLHRNPRFLMVCSHRPRMSLFEKGTRRRRRRYR